MTEGTFFPPLTFSTEWSTVFDGGLSTEDRLSVTFHGVMQSCQCALSLVETTGHNPGSFY